MSRARRPSAQTIAVLEALAAEPGEWLHGYDLCTRLGIKAGTMYPILMRLADRDLVETAWEPDPPRGRPARHLYRITPAGHAATVRVTHIGRAASPRLNLGTAPA